MSEATETVDSTKCGSQWFQRRRKVKPRRMCDSKRLMRSSNRQLQAMLPNRTLTTRVFDRCSRLGSWRRMAGA